MPLVVDVDLGLELLLERADRLAALADQQADLLRVDLDRGDARRVLGQLRARGVDHLRHLAQDERPGATLACVSASRMISNVTPVILMSIWSAVIPLLGAGDLEVHVAEVVLDAGDVGEDDVVLTLLDQPHRDPRDRAPERHARVHQRQARAADARHRRRAVRLEDVRDDADRVRELLLARDHRDQSALGERTVADVTPLRAAHRAGLADREPAGSCSGGSSAWRSPARACRAASPRASCRGRRR